MSASTPVYHSESLDASWSSEYGWPCQLQDLPNEVLILILGYLPLHDLANTRLVCARLKGLVDNHGSKDLWAKAILEGNCLWLSENNKRIIQRAANHGNVEALIILAVAHLYSEGVPEGAGKGTYRAQNGIKATEYLIKAEELTSPTPPFSWVLFRPPWASSNMCCKACVCQRMKEYCRNPSNDTAPIGIHYSIGKVLTFRETSEDLEPEVWFDLGSQVNCIHSALEVWKIKQKPSLWSESYEAVRLLRGIISLGGSNLSLHEARLELCSAYGRGFYGGKTREQAMGFIREVMETSRPVLWERIHELQESISHSVRYILIDWIIEVASMKLFSPQTVHLAINLIDRYLILRGIPRSKLQLLGVTALLVAARWSSDFILTVREASWLTEETYQYEDVVRMMGGLVAAFKGDIKRWTVCDYLKIMFDLVNTNTSIRNMAYYLSESLLLHAKFGCYSAAHLAAACVLVARILLEQEYPWPHSMVEATGLTVSSLAKCCLAIYDECLTNKNIVTDHRKVKLEAVANRYAADAFGNISEQKIMSYKELKEQLGIDPDSSYVLFTPACKPFNQTEKTDKLLSFLSDSCYLTPDGPGGYSDSKSTDPSSNSSLSDSESVSSCSSADTKHSNYDHCVEINSNLVEQFGTHCLSPCSTSPNESSLNLSLSELKNFPISTPYSPSVYSCQSLNLSDSGFPQPLFSEDTLSPMSSSSRKSPAAHRQERMTSLSSIITFGNRHLDENTVTASGHSLSQDQLSPHVSLKRKTQGVSCGDSTPLESLLTPSRQGTEETPFDPDVNYHGHNPVSKQKGVSSNTQKTQICMVSEVKGRIPLELLKVDNNIVSPACFHDDKLSRSKHHPSRWSSSTDYKENQKRKLGKKEWSLRN